MIEIFTGQVHTLDHVWPHVVPHVSRFCETPQLTTPERIRSDIESGIKQLWAASSDGSVVGVLVTEVYESGRGNVCCIWAACGSVGTAELRPVFAHVETWAREIGCTVLEVRGRRGWKRVLPDFIETGVLLEKDLRDARIH